MMKNIAKCPEKNIHCTLIQSGFVRKQFITLLINIRSWRSHISSNDINIRGKTNSSTQLKASNFNKTQNVSRNFEGEIHDFSSKAADQQLLKSCFQYDDLNIFYLSRDVAISFLVFVLSQGISPYQHILRYLVAK